MCLMCFSSPHTKGAPARWTSQLATRKALQALTLRQPHQACVSATPCGGVIRNCSASAADPRGADPGAGGALELGFNVRRIFGAGCVSEPLAMHAS